MVISQLLVTEISQQKDKAQAIEWNLSIQKDTQLLNKVVAKAEILQMEKKQLFLF